MTEDEMLRRSEDAMQELEYQEEYSGDPDAGRYADVIFRLLEWRKNAINLYPDLDRTESPKESLYGTG